MLSGRWRALLLAAKSIGFVSRTSTAGEQETELREAVRRHDTVVVENQKQRSSVLATYDDEAALHFPAFHLSLLPPTSGVHREPVRALLAAQVTDEFRLHVVQPWVAAAARQALVVGCRSVAYLRRQLEMDDAYSLLVVDHSLLSLLDAATELVPRHGARVHFVRSEAFFMLQRLLPGAVADVCIAPMPVPFWSERGSHRRLVTRDFLCVVHRVLKERNGQADPRGFVTFSDATPLAEFMMDQLEESRLIVPWTRKNPAETYKRWLPDQSASSREFAQQRLGEKIAVAASKSGPTSAQAAELIQSLDYKRRYHRALSPPQS